MGNPAANNPLAGHRQRLRQRFLRGGIAALNDYEVLELILSGAIPRRDVKPIAKALIERFGSFEAVLDATGDELLDIPGLGPSGTVALLLIRQTCIRYLEQQVRKTDLLASPKQISDYLRMKLGGGKKETLMVLYLDARRQLIASETYPGTVDHATIYRREVLETALKTRASGVILAHNHPSGICEPSSSDLVLTREIGHVLREIRVDLFDHYVVTPAACRSIFFIDDCKEKK